MKLLPVWRVRDVLLTGGDLPQVPTVNGDLQLQQSSAFSDVTAKWHNQPTVTPDKLIGPKKVGVPTCLHTPGHPWSPLVRQQAFPMRVATVDSEL